jgi:hypothetical protein
MCGGWRRGAPRLRASLVHGSAAVAGRRVGGLVGVDIGAARKRCQARGKHQGEHGGLNKLGRRT